MADPPPSSSPTGQTSLANSPQEPCILMSDSDIPISDCDIATSESDILTSDSDIPTSEFDCDIPASAYRQPAELVYRRENGPIDKEVMSVHIFGHPTDPSPPNNGVQEIGALVTMLEDAGIPCCIAAEAALQYYGTTRVMKDWFVCVPTKMFEKAVDLVRASTAFRPFATVDVDARYRLRNVFPRFKFAGLNLFFRILPGKVYLLDVKPDNIERSYTDIPYPRLAHFAQGLLDTLDRVDLTDLVDGMNLSMEWGDENLDLEGAVSADWARWKANTIAGGKAPPDRLPSYALNPPSRRYVWSMILDRNSMRRRMGLKYPRHIYETRFRLIGSRDPRLDYRPWI